MTDAELRALVREAIAKHIGGVRASDAEPPAPAGALPGSQPPWRTHPSFGKLLVPGGVEEGGACLIEPAVTCNHCGFCQSFGH
jgi:hypothetical protein